MLVNIRPRRIAASSVAASAAASPSQASLEHDTRAERPEAGLVRRHAWEPAGLPGSTILGAPAYSTVRVVAGNGGHLPRRRERVPVRQVRYRSIEYGRERRSGPHEVIENHSREAQPGLVSPFAVRVQPLDPVEWQRPVAPGELRPAESGCAAKPNPPSRATSSTTARWLPAERIRRRPMSERDVVAAVRADFDRVDAQHAVDVCRRDPARGCHRHDR